MTDLGDMLAAEHKRLATRGASRYAQPVPVDGAGTDHHGRQDIMRFFSSEDRDDIGAGYSPDAGFRLMVVADDAHDCSTHEAETVAAMLGAKREQIESEISEITAAMTAEITKRRAKLDALDAVPATDPAIDGDVFEFVLTMPRAGERQPYTYVGTKAAGRYYLTGKHNEPMTYPEFVEFVTSGPRRMVKGSFKTLNRSTPAVESREPAPGETNAAE